MDEITMLSEFSKYGLLGVLFVILLYALKVVASLYKDAQEKRIEEHKAYSERLLVATNANTDATKVMTDGFKALARAVEELNARSLPKGRR